MKHTIFALGVLLLLGGCASSGGTKKSQEEAQLKKVQPQAVIVDEEFDLLVAPEYDYEKEVPYAEQLKADTQTDKADQALKPAKKPAAVKK